MPLSILCPFDHFRSVLSIYFACQFMVVFVSMLPHMLPHKTDKRGNARFVRFSVRFGRILRLSIYVRVRLASFVRFACPSCPFPALFILPSVLPFFVSVSSAFLSTFLSILSVNSDRQLTSLLLISSVLSFLCPFLCPLFVRFPSYPFVSF